MTTPIFLNTGGGVFGAIRQRVKDDRNLLDAFGDRVRPGRVKRDSQFPYIAMTHVSCTINDFVFDNDGNRYDWWQETISLSVYADNYEAARQLGRLAHIRFSRQTFCADLIPVTLIPDSRILVMDPVQEKQAADVWHYDLRYHFYSVDKLIADLGDGE